jgi:di/tricarboxylate transporter
MEILGAIIVLGTLVAMASGRIPAVLALATGLAIAGLTGVAESSEIFAGLSNGGVITVGAMLVIAKGVVATGVVSRLTWVLLATVRSARQAIGRLMFPMGIGSALMNTTPIVAMLIPAAKELEQTRRIPAREVLLPVAHITTLAGSITLIGTSSNLLIAGIASNAGVDVQMLSFAPIAIPVALVGWAVIYFTAPLMLRGESATEAPPKRWRVEIPISASANALGRAATNLGIANTQDYTLEKIDRWGEDLDPSTPIEDGDLLVFTASENGVRALWGSPRFGLAPHRLYEVTVSSGEHGTLHDLEQDGDLLVVAAQTTKPLRDAPAIAGETCFVTGPDPAALQDSEAVALWQNAASRTPQPRKTAVALAILAGVVISASLGLYPIELIATAGALMMVLTRVITPSSAARALDWNVLFILAGSVGLGNVVVSSGLAAVIADGISALTEDSEVLVVVVFVIATAMMTNLTTNAATASILTPVALVIADSMGLDPIMLLALIGTCISFTLINPFSHQSNLMVMGPGGYSYATFARFGVPLIIACIIAAIVVGVLLIA